VTARAREILANLEGGELDESGRPRLAQHGDAPAPPPGGETQLGLFASDGASPDERAVLDALRELDPERTTPMEALLAVQAWAERLRGGGPKS
jgi:DNA mismatch repair protein MutS